MDGLSVAASLVGIGAVGCQIAIKLYALATQISTASDRISSISNDVSLTSSVLQQLGELMKQKAADDGTSIFSQSGLETTRTSATMCENIFKAIEQAAKDASQQVRGRGRIVGKIKLSKSEKAKWPFLQPSIDALRNDLREAKGTLMLMLQVTTLAFSKKMADGHEAVSTHIVEQRDIIHAILELSKQAQAKENSRSRALPVNSSGNWSPTYRRPRSLDRQSSWLDSESTLAPSLPSRSVASLPIRPTVLMAIPAQGLPERETSTHTEERSLKTPLSNPGSGESALIAKQDRCVNSPVRSTFQNSHNGSVSTLTEPTSNGNEESGKMLDLFLMKPIIQDLADVIQLSWKIHKAQMQQADLRKQISRNDQEGHPAVFDLYQDLYGHEHKAIDDEIAKAGAGASLISLKRTTSNLWHRDIYFKGVPGLQFVLERVVAWANHPPIISHPKHETAKSASSPSQKPPKGDRGKGHTLADFLNDTSFGSWADETDDAPMHTASEIGDEKRKRNASASYRFRQRRERERNPEWQHQGALLEPFSVGKAQDPMRGQCNNLPDVLEARPGSGVENAESSKPEISYMYSGPGSEPLLEYNKGYSSRRKHKSSARISTDEVKHSGMESDIPPALNRDENSRGREQPVPPKGQQYARPGLVRKMKPAALKLETFAPVEPKTPSPYLVSLRNAQFSNILKAFGYPTGVMPSKFDLNKAGSTGTIRYDLRFLMQFRLVISETPAKATIDQLICNKNATARLTNQSQPRRHHSSHSSVYGASDIASAPPFSSTSTRSYNRMPITDQASRPQSPGHSSILHNSSARIDSPRLADQHGSPRAPNSILRPPRNTSAKDIAPFREGVAPLKDAGKQGIPPNARWTRLDSKSFDSEVLDAGHERYENIDGQYLLVLRVLTKEEIEHYEARTQELRNAGDLVPGAPDAMLERQVVQSRSATGTRLQSPGIPVEAWKTTNAPDDLGEEYAASEAEERESAAAKSDQEASSAGKHEDIKLKYFSQYGLKRTKTGCLTCRRRRMKCGDERPTCKNCAKSRCICEGYNPRVIFKDPLGAYRPSGSVAYEYSDYVQPLTTHNGLDARERPLQPRNAGPAPLPVIAPQPVQHERQAWTGSFNANDSVEWNFATQIGDCSIARRREPDQANQHPAPERQTAIFINNVQEKPTAHPIASPVGPLLGRESFSRGDSPNRPASERSASGSKRSRSSPYSAVGHDDYSSEEVAEWRTPPGGGAKRSRTQKIAVQVEGGDNLGKPDFVEAEGLTRLIKTTNMSVGHYTGVPKPATNQTIRQSSFSHSSGQYNGPSPAWYTHIKPEETWYSSVLPAETGIRTSAADEPMSYYSGAKAEVVDAGNGLKGQKTEIQGIMRDRMEVKEDPSKGLITVPQHRAPAFDENVFDELYTTLSNSRQSELPQLEQRDRLMAEEAQVSLASQKKQKRRKGAGHMQKECTNCHTQATPEWRRGPSGNRDLCNGCGLRWAKDVSFEDLGTDRRRKEAEERVTKGSRGSEESDLIDYSDESIQDIQHAGEEFENIISLLEPDEPPTSPPQEEDPRPLSVHIPNTGRNSAPNSRPVKPVRPSHSHYRHTPPPRETDEADDLEFAATIAAGMNESGFDPEAEMSMTMNEGPGSDAESDDDDDDNEEGEGVEDTMDDAEAERVVRDLLGKYTTLFAT